MFAPQPPLLFPVRHRKQVSIGGPPKAVLGGPQRKPSPLPPPKPKKLVVRLPSHPPALPPLPALGCPAVPPPDAATRDIFPPDVWRRLVPDTIDVFLPGQHAWDALRQQVIEQKLVRLGVERGSGSSVPHIYAPHARAASISSPADPALLLFKLNKLQQQQQQQHDGLLSPALSSPHPSFIPSPHFLPMVPAPPRHAHTMSLVQPPAFHPIPYHTALSPAPRPPVVVPQPRHSPNGLAPTRYRPDFVRGFGLETPEEADEDEALAAVASQPPAEPAPEEPDEQGTTGTATATVADTFSRVHSRHDSRFSASLSVPSRIRTPPAADVTADVDADAAGEWTGSEDLYLSESSDSESIGEWSNPSDEERARRDRVQRRIRRRQQQLSNKPRRLPNFPKPPEEPSVARHSILQSDRDEDIMSNPSEEYLAVATGSFYASRSPHSHSLPPPLKHSRSPSAGQYSAHDPAQAHSRTSSDTFGVHYQQHLQEQHQAQLPTPISAQPSLNPFAKPFVFGAGRPTQQQQQLAPPSAPILSHSPLPSVGSTVAHASISSIHSLTSTKPLNVSAPEFKPTGFTFRPPPGVPQMPTLQLPTEIGLGLGLGPTADGGWGIGGSVSPAGMFSRPLPAPPSSSSQDMRNHQGREKRQRRNSSSGDVGNMAMFDEGDSLRSFRFPTNVDSPKSLRSMRRSMSDASVHHRVSSSDKENRDVEPFSYAAFATVATLPYVPLPKEDEGEKDMDVEDDAGGRVNIDESTYADESTAKMEHPDENENEEEEEGTSLFRSKRRPPLPLDFRQEVTRKNTVPAGLFKALANGNNREGEERTRKAVRSRLGSRDFFEEYRKPSLDDINVPRISNSLSRGLFTTGLFVSQDESEANGEESTSEACQIEKPSLGDTDDVFSASRQQQQQHRRRGSSLPDDLHDVEDDGTDRMLVESPGLELTTRDDMENFEERLVSLIEDRLGALERAMSERRDDSSSVLNSKTEAMVADMVSLFRAQLQENALRSLEDSQMDARGEMDFQLIKDIVDQGHRELADMLRRELVDSAERQLQAQQFKDIVVRVVEDVGSRTVSAIVETVADLAARQELAVNRVASVPTRERDGLVDKLVSVLSPMLQSQQHHQHQAPRVDPIDYEFLTSQLAQAVKPHISQLIDLAADKRETASLIVDQILPLLPVQAPAIDVEALTIKLTTEVRRVIAPIDAHEIKEQVADLVIERLDSRLAVRDKAFSADAITARVAESVAGAVEESVDKMQGALDRMVERQETGRHAEAEEMALRISELPAKLAERMDGLADTQDRILAKLDKPAVKTDIQDGVNAIAVNVEQLLGASKTLEGRDEELLALNKEILDKLLSLPDALVAASNVLSDTHSELVSSVESSRHEVDELRKLNAEYLVQVAKARSAHGQVRVEKDAVSDRLASVEADREHLRAQLAETQSERSAHATEITSLKIRNVELEEALSQALTRLQAADVSMAGNQQRLAGLEEANRDLSNEKQALQATVESLNLQLNNANRDKEAATQALEQVQKQNEDLVLQQGHWDSLRQAAEKIDALTNLIGQADNDELRELRLARERTKAFEAEHATLQKRLKEAENKVSNSDRAASTIRQTLAQAQQRSAEWERRTKEAEGQLELTQTRLEQAEQTQAQFETDLSLARLQSEERDAEDRLAKDREGKLRDQVALLEAKVARIQAELEQAKTPKLPQAVTIAPSPFRATSNGVSLRPDSRARTVYNMRSPTPNQHPPPVSQASFNSGTPPSGAVWDSMHAPRQPYPTPSTHLKKYPYLGPSTPRGQHNTHNYHRPAAPSPSPSMVSVTPTQGEDGWWS